MKQNVTLKLDGQLLKKAKKLAAEKHTSLSQLLTDQLSEKVRHQMVYERAKCEALQALDRKQNFGGRGYMTRDELHDRAGLR